MTPQNYLLAVWQSKTRSLYVRKGDTAVQVVLDADERVESAKNLTLAEWDDAVPAMPKAPPSREKSAAAATAQRPDRSGWAKAGEWLEKAKLLGKAIESRALDGPVPLPVLNHRRAVCLGVDAEGNRVSDACRAAHQADDGHWYCRSCGCPQWRLARLDGEKLRFPALACPAGKWSAVAGDNRDAAA